MANLQSTSISGVLTISAPYMQGSSDITGWTKLSHCYDPYTRLHVRTPLPINAMSTNSSILEIVGYHTYSGEKVHDVKILLTYNNSTPDWCGGFRISDKGYNSNPEVYASDNTYNGLRRVCFSVDKVTCCCTGYLWVRWWNNASYYSSYAWATMGANDTNVSIVKQF